jgi:hypothetical protein
MKHLIKISSALFLLTLISCGECEDKTLEVSDLLLEYLPYQEETNITMVNDSNETMDFSITPREDISTDRDDQCTTSVIKPTIVLDTDTQEEFMRIWVSFNEDLLGDNEQLWFIMDDEDGSILSSGSLKDPLFMANDITLNGVTFENVISLIINRDENNQDAIHVQRNVGLIGYEQSSETWVIQ